MSAIFLTDGTTRWFDTADATGTWVIDDRRTLYQTQTGLYVLTERRVVIVGEQNIYGAVNEITHQEALVLIVGAGLTLPASLVAEYSGDEI